MDSYLNKQTAMAAAPFGMPARGRTFGTISAGFIGRSIGFETRERVAGTQGAMGLAVPAHVPGTRAWSPPVS